MKFINIIKHLTVNFNIKHKLTVQNVNQNKEIWAIFISPKNILFSFITFIIILTGLLLLTITYTPLLDLFPGYPGNKSREILLQSVVKLDSIEKALKNWETYESNITSIMNGKTPVSLTASNNADSVKKTSSDSTSATQQELDFRSSIENDKDAKKRAQDELLNKRVNSYNLFTPLQGVITQYFNPSNSQYGIEISSYTPQEVLAASNGVVILKEWSPSLGFIVQIQHSGNVISTYKQLSSSMVSVGDQVVGGEVLGFVGIEEAATTNENKKPSLIFELWNSGKPVDPLNYILF